MKLRLYVLRLPDLSSHPACFPSSKVAEVTVTMGSGGVGVVSDLPQISMKNCHIKGSDSALESPSLAKLVSIKILGVKGYLGGGS